MGPGPAVRRVEEEAALQAFEPRARPSGAGTAPCVVASHGCLPQLRAPIGRGMALPVVDQTPRAPSPRLAGIGGPILRRGKTGPTRKARPPSLRVVAFRHEIRNETVRAASIVVTAGDAQRRDRHRSCDAEIGPVERRNSLCDREGSR